jgi:hypothetical protein
VRSAYVNVTGTLNRWIAFRITPDITTRFTTTASGLPADGRVNTSMDGSLVFRLKYAYGQVNLDPVSAGSWVRLGQQQTPYIDVLEGIYRYRFQGTLFAEREGFLSSSDVGLSGRYVLANGYGDLHAGVYNGDTYTRAEANDRKALQARATLRPFPRGGASKGLRVTAFYDRDQPVQGGARNRFLAAATFEHDHVNAGFELVRSRDRAGRGSPDVDAHGWSVWAMPPTKSAPEALLRHDRVRPSTGVDADKARSIVGVAYWARVPKGVSAALLADYEHVAYDSLLARPDETRYALHALLTF